MVRGLVVLLVTVVPTLAGEVRYEVDVSDAGAQLVRVRMTLEREGRDEVRVALPTWRPGKYLILDPAQTVRRLSASSGGVALEVEKETKSVWRIEGRGAGERVAVDYEIYANSLADRTRHADDSHVFLSGSAVFLYDTDDLEGPVRVGFSNVPKGWEVASGLEAAPGEDGVLFAPDYHTLVDSPIEIGRHARLGFEAAGAEHEIAIWGEADYDAGALKADFAAIVEEQHRVFGSLPYERYVFIVHVAPGLRGGTEHVNSTVVQLERSSLEEPKAYERFLGLVSHEMFHTWNVKQLRPAGLVPYDYQKENYTTLLWVAEGTTSYYDDLTLVRAGLISPERYLEILSEAIDDLRDHPGAALQSLEASSFDAWIKYNRRSPDDVNSTVNFYSKGALVSLLLDLRLRQATENGVTLDDVMRAMVERFPLAGGGFTREDLLATIEEMSGASFAGFFARFVAGTEALPFEDAVGVVGLELVFEEEERDEDEPARPVDANGRPVVPTLGLRIIDEGGRAVVRSVHADGPAHGAGVIHGDEIVAIDGRRITPENYGAIVESLAPGEEVEVSLFRRDMLRSIKVTVASKPAGEWTLRRVEAPTDQQVATCKSWIRQAWPSAHEASADAAEGE